MSVILLNLVDKRGKLFKKLLKIVAYDSQKLVYNCEINSNTYLFYKMQNLSYFPSA